MSNIYQAKGKTLGEQYFDLGRLFCDHIQKDVTILAKKRGRLSVIRRQVAERVWERVQKIDLCSEFCLCLSSWASGSGITENQAMWLLADNLSGCQTFMARYKTGVAIIHTEEEFIDDKHIELHMGNPHTVSISSRGERSCCIVYNNLMPGCGLYGWKKGLITAVDTLFVKEDGIDKVRKPLLSNIVSFMIWRLAPSAADPDNVIKMISQLGELIDGYGINVVYKVGSAICSYKLTLARSEIRVQRLGQNLGDYLRQTNLIDPDLGQMKWATPPRSIWRGGYRYFIKRYKTMDKDASKYSELGNFQLQIPKLTLVHKKIQKTILSDLRDSYVNPDLGALCVGLVDLSGTSVSVKRNDRLFSRLEFLDTAL